MKNHHWIENGLIHVEVIHKVTGKTLIATFSEEDKDKILGLGKIVCSSLPRTPDYCHVTASYKGKSQGLGRIIMEPPEGMQVDHINRNGLDNRRENLRIVTRQQNLLNRRNWNKSGHKSVFPYKNGGQWRVDIYVGLYDTMEEAIQVARESREKLGLPAV